MSTAVQDVLDVQAPLVQPVVYLLHFTQPYRHARHYIGYTELAIDDRLLRHRSARGAKLLQRLIADGGDFVLADTWDCASKDDAWRLERMLKRQGGGARCCSICRPGNGRGAGRGRNRFGVQRAKGDTHA